MQFAPLEPSMKQLFDEFVATLIEVTGAEIDRVSFEVESIAGGKPVDVLLNARVRGEEWLVAVELMREGYPRDIRDAVWSLDGVRPQSKSASVVRMVVAQRLSRGAKDDLRMREVGFYEAGGSFYLRHDRWLIDIQRRSVPRLDRPTPLFTGSREKVVHALLHTQGDWFTGAQLAELSETSAYSSSVLLKELENREWITTEGGRGRGMRRKLVQPGALLDEWATAWQDSKQHRTRWFLYCANPRHLIEKISDGISSKLLDSGWAFTGAIAANIESPLLTSVDVAEVAVAPQFIREFVEGLSLKPADKGYNVVLIERTGAGMLFRRNHDRGWFASPFIQYLDLLNGKGRNAELAAQLRQDILRI